jgi:glycerate dehydrogenase
MKVVVLDGHALNPGDLSWSTLEQIADVEVHPRTAPEELLARASGADILLTNKTQLREVTLSQRPALRYIGVLASGFDVIDRNVAKSRGIVVTNIPTYGTDSVAQFTFALLLELCHRIQKHSDSVAANEWAQSPDWSYHKFPLIELARKTMGIIGMGRIGGRVAQIAQAFGMQVIAADVVQTGQFDWVEVPELFSRADVVSLHCPLTPENRGFVNAENLHRMKPTALLINTSRGPLVNEADLAEALRAGKLAGAALDVLPQEPPVNGSPLIGLPNCIVTPHIAWATKEARARLLDQAVANIAAFAAGKPINRVA